MLIMIYRDLCGNKVSNLGMGNMRLPVKADGRVDEPEARKIIEYAYTHGVNYFDTAFLYHNGESEKVLGRALRQYPRESYYIVDKFWYQSRTPGMTIKDFFEIQLERCGVDYFDYYLIHNVSDATIEDYLSIDKNEGMMDYLESEKSAGRIKHLGFSCHATPDNLERFLDTYPDKFEFVQIQCNYLDWTLQNAKRKYDFLTSRNIPIVVMESCRGGKLANLNEENSAMLRKLDAEATSASWAYRWLQNLENVSVILSGMSTLEQVVDNVATFDEYRPLNSEEKNTITEIATSMANMIPCTACHYCHDCPKKLDIPSLIAMYNEANVDIMMPAFLMLQMPEDKKPYSCIKCGKCKKACPQGIDIPTVLADLNKKLSEIKFPRM